jgi:succinate dehydrogenase/fumarate reductase-like Fe-S protein
LSDAWSYLRKSEEVKSSNQPQGIHQFTRFENCIECGACISACPVTEKNAGFLGPAALAAINCELQKSPQKDEDLLALAGSKRGQHLCERALNCSRVCPTGVYPARHIADLRRILEKNNL